MLHNSIYYCGQITREMIKSKLTTTVTSLDIFFNLITSRLHVFSFVLGGVLKIILVNTRALKSRACSINYPRFSLMSLSRVEILRKKHTVTNRKGKNWKTYTE